MKKIGRYIVRGLLGRGGMARVYKVELPPIGKIAALKYFSPDPMLAQLMGRDPLCDLFVSEALTLARLQHPNIVNIHDFDHHQGDPFYVMDFAANNLGKLMGESYRVERPTRAIDIDKALDYTQQILDGLACLHDAGIIHRDIKPFNLLVDARDQIKICDFGLSKLRGEAFSGPANLNVGSPYYAPPEQEASPDQVDTSADIYPVGIMLYRMLTGRLPQTVPGDPAYLSPSKWNTHLDAAWDGFIATAIDPQPRKRFGKATDMLTALKQLTLHWEQTKEKSCALIPEENTRQVLDTPHCIGDIRRHPIKVPPFEAKNRFKLDRLWRPCIYVANAFERQPEGVIIDGATSLIWQQSGSAFPRTWLQANAYIEALNKDGLAGCHAWRLPTAEELMTLLRPAPSTRDLCIAPVFDATQRWLWSADRRSFMAAYYADIELGFIGWQDFNAPFYVKAVCSDN